MQKLYYPSNVERWRSIAEKYSSQTGVPVDVILQTIKKESAGNPDAWNPQGNPPENSRGLMQISEPTALTSPAIKLPFMLLDTLYNPDTNIKHGTNLLKWKYEYLKPYFPKSMDEKTRWMVASSSYNQGHGYYKWALQTIDENDGSYDWDNILNNVLDPNPKYTTRTPWRSSAQTYGPSVINPIPKENLELKNNTFWKRLSSGAGSKLSGKQASSGGGVLMPILLGTGLASIGAIVYLKTKK